MTVDTWVNICALIFGLVGVFITLLYNARLARKQQDRQWEYEQEKAQAQDAHERAVLRSALIVELQAIHDEVQTHITQAAESMKKEGLIAMTTYPEFSTEIYQAVLPRIGMLSDPEIHALAQAYKGLTIQAQTLRLIGKNEGIGQVRISPDQVGHYINVMNLASQKIDPVLKTLADHQD